MDSPQPRKKTEDLAGYCSENPHYLEIRARVNTLIDRYLSLEILNERLTDLPTQFTQPHMRKWEPIDWNSISQSQIVGVDPELFIILIAGATEIEAPIREYSQESWNYLQSIHSEMAYFIGGAQNPDGSVASLGIWEKEERQHAPAFKKIYNELTGEKLEPKPNSVRGYQPSDDAMDSIYNHIVSRISTEWGAISVYLWLMAHSTGALQQAIAQPLQDEVNHLAKFWGFCRWAFEHSYYGQVKGSTKNLLTLAKHHQGERTDGNNLTGKMNAEDAIELAFIFSRVMVRVHAWDRELSNSFLTHLFGRNSLA